MSEQNYQKNAKQLLEGIEVRGDPRPFEGKNKHVFAFFFGFSFGHCLSYFKVFSTFLGVLEGP